MSYGPAGSETHIDQSFSIIIRVDPGTNRWCSGDCSTIHAIVKEDGKQLTLEETPLSSTAVQRETGRYTSVRGGRGFAMVDTGQCTKQPPTAMPPAKF